MFETTESQMHYIRQGNSKKQTVFWAHGWGQSHAAFLPMVNSLESLGNHVVIDAPGFGQSALPPQHWGTAEYADFMAEFIQKECAYPVVWVGHSFGCRVGLQMAIRHPDLIKGLFLIGGAGLRRKRTLWENIILYTKIYTFKFCKKLLCFGLSENWLKSKFGSPDYRNASPEFRPVMVRVNADDLTDLVPQVKCPVKLLYGSNDKQTPPEIGYRLEKLIDHAEMLELPDQDHYTVLGGGRHTVVAQLKDFLKSFSVPHVPAR